MKLQVISGRGRTVAAVLAATLALAGLGSSLGCSSNAGAPLGSQTVVQTVLSIELLSGQNIHGAEFTMTFQPSLTLVSVTAVGDLAPADCAQNLGSQPIRVGCLLNAADEFDSPDVIWDVRFEHVFAVVPLASVTSVTCAVSDEFGTVVPAACSVIP